MKKKTILCAILIILFQLLLSGCGEAHTLFKRLPGEKTQQVFKTGPGGSAKSEAPYNNMAVVIDTVVDVFEEADTKSRRISQALYNQPLQIIEEKEYWTKVKLVDGCTGWIKSKYLDGDCTSIMASNYKYRIVVTAKRKNIRWGAGNNVVAKDVVMGSEFYTQGKRDGGYEVALPQGQKGWIDVSGTIELETADQIPKTEALDFITTADKFRGATYQLGGISSWGVDASGLTYICAKINGVNLPREVNAQYEAGREVKLEEAAAGDLIFFSTNEDQKDISHVGILLGDEKFLHANKSKGMVAVSMLSESYYQKRIVGIRRVFE